MNVTNLILQLKSKITDKTLDQQMISKAVKLLEVGAVESVVTFSQLPAASTSAGQLYYVELDGLYWSNGEYWVPIAKTNIQIMFSWGCNNTGQLGDNCTVNRSSPVPVLGNFTDWCQVSSGGRKGLFLDPGFGNFNLSVRQNGTAWAWGNNFCGRLGDGTLINRSSPVSVVGGFTDWCQVSAGAQHSLGLRQNGTAWAWGQGLYGRLGDNNQSTRLSPVSVVGGFTDWCQVSAGGLHSLGVRQNGTAWAWGHNVYGQLGDGTIGSGTCKASPVSVVGGFTDWCQVSAGGLHSLGLRQDGNLWSWGCNGQGRLGDNSTVNKSSPVSVVGGFTDWCQVSAGGAHSLGVRQNGTAWAWGSGFGGSLGDNTSTSKSSPVSVVGGFTDWCQVSAADDISFGLRSNGTLWAWGSGFGQLGDGTIVSKNSPVSVVGGFTDWYQVSAGSPQILALRNRLLT